MSHISHSKRITDALGPVLTAALLASFLTACTGGTTQEVEGTESSSSSSESSASSAESVSSSSSEASAESTSSSSSSAASSEAADSSASSAQAAAESGKYADGTYSAVGAYKSPGGNETVNVSLTVKDDMIVASTYEGTAEGGKSKTFQEAFGSAYQVAVIGKSIDSVKMDVINGSSLTPKGFMDALEKIKLEAAAS